MEKWKVVIYEKATKKVEHEIECSSDSYRAAERVERGVNINLNHKDYYTLIEKAKEE